jgi:hypothetical protein
VVFIWKIPPSSWGWGYQPVSFEGGNMKRKKKKEETVKEKGEKTEDKGEIEVKSVK